MKQRDSVLPASYQRRFRGVTVNDTIGNAVCECARIAISRQHKRWREAAQNAREQPWATAKLEHALACARDLQQSRTRT